MIESFTMWRVKDREFTDYAEAVRYDNATNEAVKDIEFFDEEGRPITFEQAQEKEFGDADVILIKNEEALKFLEKCFEDFNCPDKIGWNRYDYNDFEWKNFAEEKRIFDSNWEKVRERIKEEQSSLIFCYLKLALRGVNKIFT